VEGNWEQQRTNAKNKESEKQEWLEPEEGEGEGKSAKFKAPKRAPKRKREDQKSAGPALCV
jgi:hypothetical protein